MLTIFVGTDVVRAKAEAAKRAKGSEVVRLGEGGEPFSAALGYVEQRGMFAPAVTLVLDRPLETDEGKELMSEYGETLVAASAQVYAIVGDVTLTEQKKFPKGAKVESFELKSVTEVVPPNTFALVDAVQAGDKKRAWILYQQLLASGASAEEIHGTLAWAARGVVLASNTKSADEAGMKPFPYGKAKDVARKVGRDVAVHNSAELVKLYHDARRGMGSLEDLLEVYLLKK